MKSCSKPTPRMIISKFLDAYAMFIKIKDKRTNSPHVAENVFLWVTLLGKRDGKCMI